MALRRSLTDAIRSGWRRYPRELMASVGPVAGGPARRGLPPRALLKAWRRLEAIEGASAVAWLGHCSVLLRLGGKTILTDPVLAPRIGVTLRGRTVGLSRLVPPALDAHQLPPIDLVLVSHAHFDHLDKPTLRAIAGKDTVVVTAARTRRLIPAGFARVIELDWMEALEVNGLTIAAIRPKHWGARTAWDIHRGYNAYVLQPAGAAAPTVLFAGDTAFTHAFDDLRGIELAIMGIGAYAPWEHAHATPEQVWRMVTAMRAERLLPVHHSTFDLGEEPAGEPLERLLRAAGPEAERVLALPIGGLKRLGGERAADGAG